MRKFVARAVDTGKRILGPPAVRWGLRLWAIIFAGNAALVLVSQVIEIVAPSNNNPKNQVAHALGPFMTDLQHAMEFMLAVNVLNAAVMIFVFLCMVLIFTIWKGRIWRVALGMWLMLGALAWYSPIAFALGCSVLLVFYVLWRLPVRAASQSEDTDDNTPRPS